MACLDTTLLIDLARPKTERGKRAAKKIIELVERGETLATSRFNVAELNIGVELARDREAESESIRRVLFPLSILEFTADAAECFAKCTAHLRRIGRPAGDMDVLIAATALTNGHNLVTRNGEHFANIHGLEVETY
jgi:tRNA(fMet)-specific endonuclease VapC